MSCSHFLGALRESFSRQAWTVLISSDKHRSSTLHLQFFVGSPIRKEGCRNWTGGLSNLISIDSWKISTATQFAVSAVPSSPLPSDEAPLSLILLSSPPSGKQDKATSLKVKGKLGQALVLFWLHKIQLGAFSCSLSFIIHANRTSRFYSVVLHMVWHSVSSSLQY